MSESDDEYPPGYRQKNLSVETFQSMLRDRVDDRRENPLGATSFDDIRAEIENPNNGILFHDGNNRSMEHLMSDMAKNAMMHNLCVELLRKHKIALCVADTAGRWPFMEDLTSDFVYVRLHGDRELYASGYTDESLDRWAERCLAWASTGQFGIQP